MRALQNACRHRGVKVVEGRGTCKSGFICPFHGWCYGLDGVNTFVSKAKSFSEHNLEPGDIDLVPVRCEAWGGCAWINLDDDAPPLRELHRALRHRARRLEGRVHAHRVVGGLPPPGQLEAGRRGLLGAVPRDRDPSRARHPQAIPPQGPRGLRPRGLHRRRAALPPRHERGHGRDGPCQRRGRRRAIQRT